ncbi:MAG TPA: nucleoside hydrolase [Methylomirabilota bacterium]|nr:nucleoside hydrolase [Methylomirabilota bacterium]
MTHRIPFVLDCDPGHDDALALVVGLARPELELVAVTTVAGNAGLPETTRNALRVLTLLGRTDIPVAAGAAGPLMRPLHVADNVHGASGLEGADLPEPAFAARPEGAVELLRSVLESASEPVTIAAVGPLTNIALLVRTHPHLVERIASIRVMGGAITEGNTTASAEFNIWQDPEAARIVFDCGRPVTLMTLDTTHQALFGPADVARLEGLGTKAARVFADLLRFFGRFHAERYGWDGSPIHDAVTVAHLAVPDLVRTVPYRVDVETTSELTRGRTVVDLYAQTGRPPNVDVGREIDRERFIDLLIDAVATLGAVEAGAR